MNESTEFSGLFFPMPGVALTTIENDLPLAGSLKQQSVANKSRKIEDSGQTDLHAVPVSQAVSNVKPARYFRFKRPVDMLLTVVLLIIALPLMVAVGLAILWTDGRPIFFRQTRVGKHGRTFRIWKFRTMCDNAESVSGAVWSHASDPRVTSLGRWLRCSHLDELPQLFNVLAGDMNLIGPRPERPEFVRELVQELPFYDQRLAARPGITGLAQLRLDYDQSLTQVRDKVILDLEYIQSTNLIRDAALLAGTLPHVVRKLKSKWCSDRQSHGDSNRTVEYNGPDIRVGISPADLSHPAVSMPTTAFQPHFADALPYSGASASSMLVVPHGGVGT